MLNQFLAAALTPEVGMGVTRLGYTDREPFTIIEIVSEREIVVQKDAALRTDANGMSEHQEYQYAPNPKGSTVTLTLRKSGRWIAKGCSDSRGATAWRIGERMAYYDYSF